MTLLAALGSIDPIIIEKRPDRPNSFLRNSKMISNSNVLNVYEGIYIGECYRLRDET